MKIAVCDDELVARENIITCIEDYCAERGIEIEYEAFESYLMLEKRIAEFDVFIMDYQTPEIDGMTFAQKIREEYGSEKAIIFVTSFREIVYDAFSVRTHRFLLKPVDRLKFFEAIDSYISLDKNSVNIAVRSDGFTDIIRADSIFYIEVRGKDCCIFLEDDEIISRSAISFFEEKLKNAPFYRVHRNYLVNMKKIRCFDKSKIELTNGRKIDISSRRYTQFCKEYLKLK